MSDICKKRGHDWDPETADTCLLCGVTRGQIEANQIAELRSFVAMVREMRASQLEYTIQEVTEGASFVETKQRIDSERAVDAWLNQHGGEI